MARSVKNVKNSLKFKAKIKPGILSVRVGVKKYQLPVPARILTSSDYLFLTFTASSELYRIKDKKLQPTSPDQDAADAYQQLNPGRRRRKRGNVEMPQALAAALKSLPSGFRLGYDLDGQPRLIKKRSRKKRGA